jgi:predicted membrane channel-forming protein YqfA (hemolysin III family)
MREAFVWLFLCSFTSIVGGVFYAAKFPESVWNPNGTFNFMGNSHNILHVFVVAACTTGIISTFPISRYEAIVWQR